MWPSGATPTGRCVFWAGSIAVHVFAVGIFSSGRCAERRAAVPRRPQEGAVRRRTRAALSSQSKPNALKFERFIFDLLPHAANAIVVEYPEAEVFAPLKNAPGADRDTPEYVQRFMMRPASPLAARRRARTWPTACRSKSARSGRSTRRASRPAPIVRKGSTLQAISSRTNGGLTTKGTKDTKKCQECSM